MFEFQRAVFEVQRVEGDLTRVSELITLLSPDVCGALSRHIHKCYISLNDMDREPDLLLNLQKRYHTHLIKKI